MPGTWRITGTSLDGGWLPIPALDQDADRAGWIRENTDVLRGAWGAEWTETAAQAFPLMLENALERRRSDDALAFQVWPAVQPLCVFVHVAMGIRDPGDAMPGPGDGILFESEMLGAGVLVPRVERIGSSDVAGYDIVFAFDENVVVIVSVEPTFSDLLAFVTPSINAFVASLSLVGRRALMLTLVIMRPPSAPADDAPMVQMKALFDLCVATLSWLPR